MQLLLRRAGVRRHRLDGLLPVPPLVLARQLVVLRCLARCQSREHVAQVEARDIVVA